MPDRKRIAHVGLGGRSIMFTEALAEKYRDYCEVVGLCDLNEGRLQQAIEYFSGKGFAVPTYGAEQFDRMVKETSPDVVVVTTRDSAHDKYICRAMELGCDAVTEKPMTIDAERCQRILDTQKATDKHLAVTFNYRYSPPRTQIKDLLMSGVIGRILSVDFHWLLNTRHGADYFHRWHRNKANSGGLMVHKATHHFDLVNWWLSAVPVRVVAMGHREFYTPEQAARLKLHRRAERCLECAEAQACRFRLDLLGHDLLKAKYYDNEKYDGYQRDRCVFGEGINIEDSMNVLVEYDTGAKMAYSLNAHAPWEGYTIAFNGSKGRLEHRCQESVYVSGDGSVPGETQVNKTSTIIFPHFESPYEVGVWVGTGGHGGGDDPLLDDLFHPNPEPDKYLRAADQRAGAYSILTGVAANKSMATGEVVRIEDLVLGLEKPDYPSTPEL